MVKFLFINVFRDNTLNDCFRNSGDKMKIGMRISKIFKEFYVLDVSDYFDRRDIITVINGFLFFIEFVTLVSLFRIH
jgi:hypothetical protein